MALKHLSTQQMIKISTPWLDPEGQRPILEGVEEMKSSIPILEAAHDELAEAVDGGDFDAESLRKLTVKMSILDAKHDSKARGVFDVLSGLMELSEDPDYAHEILTLRDKLLPKGLSVTMLSYVEQAEAIETAQSALSDEDHALLATLPGPKGSTLDDAVQAWFEAGEELRGLWETREESKQAEDESHTVGEVIKARNKWIGAVRVFMATVDFVDVEEETKDALIKPLRDTEKMAMRKLTIDES